MIFVAVPFWNVRKRISATSYATFWVDDFSKWYEDYKDVIFPAGSDVRKQKYHFNVKNQDTAVLLKMVWG